MIKRYQPHLSLVRRFTLDVHAVQGTFEGNELTMLIADDGSTLDYVARMVFPEGANISKKRRTTALSAPDLIDSGADLVVVGANRLLVDRYVRRGFQILPKWVQLFLPVEQDPLDRLMSLGSKTRHYFNRMLSKVNDAGFECEVVSDDSWFSRFYYEMYMPYAYERFNDGALVFEPEVLEKYYSKGQLVLVNKNGKPVAGAIISRTRDVLHMPYPGVAGGDVELMKDGAMFALHLYLAQMAHREGCKLMDFGLCRPFLSDGTLVYKLKWHMELAPYDSTTGVFALATPNCTPQAVKFLHANPYFYISGNECCKSGGETRE